MQSLYLTSPRVTRLYAQFYDNMSKASELILLRDMYEYGTDMHTSYNNIINHHFDTAFSAEDTLASMGIDMHKVQLESRYMDIIPWLTPSQEIDLSLRIAFNLPSIQYNKTYGYIQGKGLSITYNH